MSTLKDQHSPAQFYYRKCLKVERNERKKFLKSQNCNFDHPLKDQKVVVSCAKIHYVTTQNTILNQDPADEFHDFHLQMFDSKGTRNRLSFVSSISSSKSSLDPLSSFDGCDDPLSQFARQELDPLSQMAAEFEAINVSNNKNSSNKKVKVEPSSVESWHSRRAVILNKYTTSERLSIATSFLGAENVVKNQTTVEKVRHRLEQLDDFQDIHYMQNLTQQEYISKIQQLNNELVSSWKTDQRVKSLKIAIQCSKLLADPSSVMQFYPSKFVLVTDILDIFGKLVYDRLKGKSENE